MNWVDYLPLSEKTLSRQFNCSETEQLFLHAIIGSLTEIEELLENYQNGQLVVETDKQGSVAEESADMFWYLSILFRELHLDSEDEFIIENKFKGCPYEILMEYLKINLRMLDMLKKKIYYNKQIDMVLFTKNTFELFHLLKQYCLEYKTNFETILEKNILKLKARYGEKFSSEKAINRDLETEKKILENE
jgi:hypothetical protein